MSTVTPGTIVFFGLAALVILCAAGIAFSRNLLRSAFLLLGALGGTAGLYLHLGADFVGVTQLLLYVGGVLVLLLFAILLTARIGDVKLSNPALGRRLAIPVVLAGTAGLLAVVLRAPWPATEAVAAPTTARLGDGFLREWLLPFELASVILLAVLVGAVSVARRASRPAPTRARDEQAG